MPLDTQGGKKKPLKQAKKDKGEKDEYDIELQNKLKANAKAEKEAAAALLAKKKKK